jgi:S1-C subfamily serine protease
MTALRRTGLVLALAVVVATADAAVAAARSTAPIGTGVVTITTRLGYAGAEAAGTGMVLTSSGEILTNNHVIAGATTIRVTVPASGRSYTARVVGYAVGDDVAVLRLQGASNLKTVAPASATVTRGQSVTAVGNAGGRGSLTTVSGRITATGKSITARDDQGAAERLTGLIETNAPVVAGDSGGALLNTRGEVIGMITAAATSGRFEFEDARTSAGYAIPIAKALRIRAAIDAGKRSATIHVGPTAFLGVQIESAQTDTGSGAAIAAVVRNGPAATAGLEAGDLITSVDGRAVSTPTALRAIVLSKTPGAKVSVRYLDSTGAHTVTVTLGSGPPQ